MKSFTILSMAAAVYAQSVVQVSPISQITDGQIQAPTTGTSVTVSEYSQLTGGAVETPSPPAPPVTSQLTGGGVETPSPPGPGPVMSQLTGGAIDLSTSKSTLTVSPISQITDGQVQAPTTGTEIVVSSVRTQITGGEVVTPSPPVLPSVPSAPTPVLPLPSMSQMSQITGGGVNNPTAPTGGLIYPTNSTTLSPFNPNGAAGLYIPGSLIAALAAVVMLLA